MDLRSPISSVIPTRHGLVLAVLARAGKPLSGRRVAELAGHRVDQKHASVILRQLAEAGVVIGEDHPPAILWRLNRQHLAAEGIESLVMMRERLIERLAAEFASWKVMVAGAWMFGSAARGDGDAKSDIDLLVVRRQQTKPDDEQWSEQTASLMDRVSQWTGNMCAVLELSEIELAELLSSGSRLARDLQGEGIRLAGPSLSHLGEAG